MVAGAAQDEGSGSTPIQKDHGAESDESVAHLAFSFLPFYSIEYSSPWGGWWFLLPQGNIPEDTLHSQTQPEVCLPGDPGHSHRCVSQVFLDTATGVSPGDFQANHVDKEG